MAMRNRFSPPVKVTSDPVGPSKTQQHFAQEADINNIMAKNLKNRIPGVPPQPIGDPKATRKLQYGYQAAFTYHEALNKVIEARTLFDSLPAKVRTLFGNDVGAMLAFADNPKNRSEALKYGLVVPTDEEAAAETKVQLEAATAKAVAQLVEAFRAPQGGSTEAGNAPRADEEAQPSYKPPREGGK